MDHGTDQEPQQPTPAQHTIVINYDNHGSRWGTDTVPATEQLIADEYAAGTLVSEWETLDRDGQPLRVVRIPDSDWLDTICVFTTETRPAVAA